MNPQADRLPDSEFVPPGRDLAVRLGQVLLSVPLPRVLEIVRFPGFVAGPFRSAPGTGTSLSRLRWRGVDLTVLDWRTEFAEITRPAPAGTACVLILAPLQPAAEQPVGLVVDALAETIEPGAPSPQSVVSLTRFIGLAPSHEPPATDRLLRAVHRLDDALAEACRPVSWLSRLARAG